MWLHPLCVFLTCPTYWVGFPRPEVVIPCYTIAAYQYNRLPSIIVTAFPDINTLSPATWTFNLPPLSDNWYALNFSFPSLFLQNGPKQQWAEPVTGSSNNQISGAKNRETKSYSLDFAVTITPLMGTFISFVKSGVISLTTSSDSASINSVVVTVVLPVTQSPPCRSRRADILHRASVCQLV